MTTRRAAQDTQEHTGGRRQFAARVSAERGDPTELLHMPSAPEGVPHDNGMVTMVLRDNDLTRRDALRTAMADDGIDFVVRRPRMLPGASSPP